MKINQVPAAALQLITMLNQSGHSAYLVGGCVRDSLMGATPKDWDICTSARPEQMQKVFAGLRTIETGLKHGTLTVLVQGEPYEITTFRTDGAYTDHRHPDGVSFVTDLREDLSRRDFTVNSMAWHPDEGLVDLFGGQEDLKAGIIRCVGDPCKRFDEDALRIMRALRFSSVLDFSIDPMTADAAFSLRDTLSLVAAERIRVELDKLLCGKAAGSILRTYRSILAVILPELAPMFDFCQHTPYHRYDVWEHSIRALEAIPPRPELRLAMLLHDCGKPDCFTMDEHGIGHAYGHGRRSWELSNTALQRLKLDKVTEEEILTLVRWHDIDLTDDPKLLKHRLNRFGEKTLRNLLLVQQADALGKGTANETEIRQSAAAISSAIDRLLAEDACFTLKSLAVNGRDLMQRHNLKGPALGQMLQQLLIQVMDEKTPNEKEALLTLAGQLLNDMEEERT